MKKGITANMMIMIFLVMILGASFVLAGGIPSTSVNNPYVMTPTPQEVVVAPKDSSAQKSLQLQSLPFTTIEPTVEQQVQPTVFIPHPTIPAAPTPITGGSGNYCALDVRHGSDCTCPPGKQEVLQCSGTCPQGASFVPGNGAGSGCFITPSDSIYSQYVNDPNCGGYCVGKPVIYLYPRKDMFVDVSVKSSGNIVVSDPLYPDGGWKHVLAHTGGRLTYKGGEYSELFYETSVQTVSKPVSGRILETAQLPGQLSKIITQLGLLPNERQEFLDYWLPRLYELHKPYIFFSLIEKTEKERIDNVNIVPKPDIFISFLAYFKPQSLPTTNSLPLIIHPVPSRSGFTAVEWGGVIDSK